MVTGGRQRRRLGEMTDEAWEATLALLSTQKQGEAMWRLAQVAPPVWSVRLLRQLADIAWMPQAEEERAGFVEIGRLAAMLAGKTPELHRFVHSLSTLGERKLGSIDCVALSPDGWVLASGGQDGMVQMCNLEPLWLSYLPLGDRSAEDIALVQQTLQSGETSPAERGWLEFLLAMMRWQRRFDIGVGEAPRRMEVGEFDIEIAG